MTQLSRIEREQTRRALGTFRSRRQEQISRQEERISEMTGAQERVRVFQAIEAAAQLRERQDLSREVAKAVEYAVTRERGRCLAICGLLPTNHAALWIAQQIVDGASQ